MDYVSILAAEFGLRPAQVSAAVELLDAGNTIPFIARYRKEATGSLDDQVLREMAERLEYRRHPGQAGELSGLQHRHRREALY